MLLPLKHNLTKGDFYKPKIKRLIILAFAITTLLGAILTVNAASCIWKPTHITNVHIITFDNLFGSGFGQSLFLSDSFLSGLLSHNLYSFTSSLHSRNCEMALNTQVHFDLRKTRICPFLFPLNF